jgi:hypothetical protein
MLWFKHMFSTDESFREKVLENEAFKELAEGLDAGKKEGVDLYKAQAGAIWSPMEADDKATYKTEFEAWKDKQQDGEEGPAAEEEPEDGDGGEADAEGEDDNAEADADEEEEKPKKGKKAAAKKPAAKAKGKKPAAKGKAKPKAKETASKKGKKK